MENATLLGPEMNLMKFLAKDEKAKKGHYNHPYFLSHLPLCSWEQKSRFPERCILRFWGISAN